MSTDELAALPFMAAFTLPERDAWRSAVAKVLKGADFEKRLVARTADGLRIEPLYPAAHGSPRPSRAADGRWKVAVRMDHPVPSSARELALAELSGGADMLVLSFAGARAARDYGLTAGGPQALDEALDGVMFDLIGLRLDPAPDGPRHARDLAALAGRRGHDPAVLAVSFGLDPLGVAAATGRLPRDWAEMLAHDVRALRDLGFAGPFVTVDTRVVHEAGASEAQELAVAMAAAVAYLRVLEPVLGLAGARDAIDFTFTADTDEFLTVSKLRAARLLWERVQAACGLTPAPMALHVETAWRSLTRRDPNVNMLRATVSAFSAGVGGADSLTVLPHTAAIGLPDGFARRVARNTQLVLLDEASLWRVSDPAAGAGGFEALTEGLCEEAWRQFQDIERLSGSQGHGLAAALVSGELGTWLAAKREARTRAIATRREPITGTSEYPLLTEAVPATLDAARPPFAPMTTSDDIVFHALPSTRSAEAFETLRDKADAAAGRTGARPNVFLATLGTVAEFTARAGFARGLFEAGGLAAPAPVGFAAEGRTDIPALVEAWRGSGAALACLCGSDTAYEAEGVDAALALHAAGASVWLAGRPAQNEAALREAGVSRFVFAGGDALEALHEAQGITLRR